MYAKRGGHAVSPMGWERSKRKKPHFKNMREVIGGPFGRKRVRQVEGRQLKDSGIFAELEDSDY